MVGFVFQTTFGYIWDKAIILHALYTQVGVEANQCLGIDAFDMVTDQAEDSAMRR